MYLFYLGESKMSVQLHLWNLPIAVGGLLHDDLLQVQRAKVHPHSDLRNGCVALTVLLPGNLPIAVTFLVTASSCFYC